jgi:hypothetical protein
MPSFGVTCARCAMLTMRPTHCISFYKDSKIADEPWCGLAVGACERTPVTRDPVPAKLIEPKLALVPAAVPTHCVSADVVISNDMSIDAKI